MAGPDALDPRLVYRHTTAGEGELTARRLELTPGARRLLMLIDGRRSAAQLALSVRSGELASLVRELEDAALIVVARVLDELPAELGAGNHRQLVALKLRLRGAFERELGPSGIVLDARVQDCVNLMVMRSVLREVIEQLQARKDRAAAERVLRTVRDVTGSNPDH